MSIEGVAAESFSAPSVRQVLIESVATAANVSVANVILQRITDLTSGLTIYEASRRLQAAGVLVDLRLKTSTSAQALQVGAAISADVSSFAGTVLRLMQEADNFTFFAANVTFSTIAYNFPPVASSPAALEVTILAGAVGGAILLLCIIGAVYWGTRRSGAGGGKGSVATGAGGAILSAKGASASSSGKEESFVVMNPMANSRHVVAVVADAPQEAQLNERRHSDGSKSSTVAVVSSAPTTTAMDSSSDSSFVVVNPMVASRGVSGKVPGPISGSSVMSMHEKQQESKELELVRMESVGGLMPHGEQVAKNHAERNDFEPVNTGNHAPPEGPRAPLTSDMIVQVLGSTDVHSIPSAPASTDRGRGRASPVLVASSNSVALEALGDEPTARGVPSADAARNAPESSQTDSASHQANRTEAAFNDQPVNPGAPAMTM